MTVDEIVQKIYEERYVDPKHPEITAFMRDGMIREVVQRALELEMQALENEAKRETRRLGTCVAFRECAACADKPGAPQLCDACLHNRTTIDQLAELVALAIVFVEALRATDARRHDWGLDWMRDAKRAVGL